MLVKYRIPGHDTEIYESLEVPLIDILRCFHEFLENVPSWHGISCDTATHSNVLNCVSGF